MGVVSLALEQELEIAIEKKSQANRLRNSFVGKASEAACAANIYIW